MSAHCEQCSQCYAFMNRSLGAMTAHCPLPSSQAWEKEPYFGADIGETLLAILLIELRVETLSIDGNTIQVFQEVLMTLQLLKTGLE